MTAIVFIDTEFTNFNDPGLLSLGMVLGDGQEFYAELDRNDPQAAKTFARASHFVREEAVLPQWGLVPDAAMSRQRMGERAADQLRDWSRALGQPLSVAFDYPADWQLLRRLLMFAKRWQEVGDLLRPRNVVDLTSQPEGQAAAEAMLVQVRAQRGLGEHHALADALALRAAFRAAMANKEVR